jgi:putative ABC transport system permease protein
MSVGMDLCSAFRSMRGSPGFTAVTVTSLALGIGVNIAIFSLIDQLLLWSVPARDPGRLVYLEGGRSTTLPFFREYLRRNQVFAGMLASSQVIVTGVRPEGAPAVEIGHICFVSGTYFQTLGEGAVAGRVILESDDGIPGGSPVVVLSYDYWQRRFAGNLQVIGCKLAVNGFPLEIAGIAEKGFGGIFNMRPADAFIPLAMYPAITPMAAPV